MEITLQMDEQQVGILLGQIEGMFNGACGRERCEGTLDEEIEIATDSWQEEKQDFEFELLRIAPVYRQLLKFWTKGGETNGVTEGKICEFAAALSEARGDDALDDGDDDDAGEGWKS
jgi:hypothetical protein